MTADRSTFCTCIRYLMASECSGTGRMGVTVVPVNSFGDKHLVDKDDTVYNVVCIVALGRYLRYYIAYQERIVAQCASLQ